LTRQQLPDPSCRVRPPWKHQAGQVADRMTSGLGASVAWLPLAGPTIRLTRAVKPS
jgi:hypothetical protein